MEIPYVNVLVMEAWQWLYLVIIGLSALYHFLCRLLSPKENPIFLFGSSSREYWES